MGPPQRRPGHVATCYLIQIYRGQYFSLHIQFSQSNRSQYSRLLPCPYSFILFDRGAVYNIHICSGTMFAWGHPKDIQGHVTLYKYTEDSILLYYLFDFCQSNRLRYSYLLWDNVCMGPPERRHGTCYLVQIYRGQYSSLLPISFCQWN